MPTLKECVIEDWKRVRERTLRIIDAMPADKLDYRVFPEAMSFLETVTHTLNYSTNMPLAALGLEGRQLEVKPVEFADKAALLAYYRQASDELYALLERADEARLLAIYNHPRGGPRPALVEIDRVREHEVHHRGQMMVALRQLGVAPPA